jgi:hypothetical protein
MAKNSNQGKTQKPQSNQKITINESVKGSGNAGGSNRSRTGNAGEGTNNTGPRKK